MTNGFTFDQNGNQTAYYDGAGNKTSYTFDALNRQVQVKYANTTTNFTGYDAAGRRVAETNQDNIVTRFAYDGVGRLTVVTNGIFSAVATNWANYAYDEAGNEISQTDALNRSTTFAYDSLGRRTKRTFPMGTQQETFGYDAVGNVLSHTDFNGLVVTNQYDALSRLYKRFNGATTLETYTYTGSGRLATRADSAGLFSWVYDARDRVVTNTTPIGKLGYTYDANGNLASLKSTNSSGISLAYQYDALNRLTNTIDNFTSGNTTNVFDAAGNLLTVKYPNGITNQYAYDSLNRLTKMSAGLRGAQRGDFTYTLKSGGSRTSLADNVGGTTRTFNWSYDSLARLTNETVSGATTGTLTNVYDRVGNRTAQTGSLGNLTGGTSTFDVNDRVDNDSNPNNANIWFDANGNMKTNGAAVYSYDWANRLVAYTNGTTTNGITYDAAGNRIKKITPNGTTVYLVAEINPTGYPQVVEESTVSGGTTNLSKVYTYGLARIGQRQISGNVLTFYGYDGLGSVRYLTDTSGTIQNAYAYDAFGNAIVSNAPIANVYLFAGEQFDPDLKLSYNRARYYDPSIGRFLTLDTYPGNNEDPLSLHKYLYCQGNPVNRVDPSGLTDFSLTVSYTGDAVLWFSDAYGEAKNVLSKKSVNVSIGPFDNVFECVRRRLDSENFAAGHDKLVNLAFAAHGFPGHFGNFSWDSNHPELDVTDFTMQNLDRKNSAQGQLLDYLRPFLDSKSDVTLLACEQAKGSDGLQLMQDMADRLRVPVSGYDDWIAVWARGNRWTAYPGGTQPGGKKPQLVKAGRPWKGTLSQQIYSGDILNNEGWLSFP
jgi:RHS repeat-associated protein